MRWADAYAAASCSPTALDRATGHAGFINTEHAALLGDLPRAIDAGDEEASVSLPTFRPWLVELLRDPEAAPHEPGSAGHVARMFALRELANTSS